ncbi:hypothetical protein D3C81_2191360 [compost metagenome]
MCREAHIDTNVVCQVARMRRDAVFIDVIRASDCSHAHLAADRNGNHIFVDGVAQANPSIEALCNDVAKSIIHIEFDIDIGVGK